MCSETKAVIISVTLKDNKELYLVAKDNKNYEFSQQKSKATKFLEREGQDILNSLISLKNQNLKFKLIKMY